MIALQRHIFFRLNQLCINHRIRVLRIQHHRIPFQRSRINIADLRANAGHPFGVNTIHLHITIAGANVHRTFHRI